MIVSWMTTNRCNLNCKHCYQDAGEASEDELTTKEALELIDQIAESGFKIMIFSGGEPLLREDILPLVSYAASRGLRPVFGTNGMLISRKMAGKLKDCGAAAMGISLDSLDAEKHNTFRGKKDAFSRTLQGIENCREAGLPFQIHTTVMDWNREEIGKLTDFAVDRGAIGHYLFFLVPVGRGTELEADSLTPAGYEELLSEIMEKQRNTTIDLKPTCAPQFTRIAREMQVKTRFTKGCLAGLTYCVVSPVGIVKPCAYMVQEAGDVKRDTFSSIWKSSELFHRLRTEDYRGACGKCDYKSQCGGCRARAAYYNDGDFMAEDPFCIHGRQLDRTYGAAGQKARTILI